MGTAGGDRLSSVFAGRRRMKKRIAVSLVGLGLRLGDAHQAIGADRLYLLCNFPIIKPIMPPATKPILIIERVAEA